MGHVPHLFVPGPWDGERIEPDPAQRRHLEDVLRRADGTEVSYTDGAGMRGAGVFADGFVLRGSETADLQPTRSLTLAVAPPDSKDRVRWLVEKSTELGVSRLRWLRTTYGQGRVPPFTRTRSWMVAALQQSRRSFVMVVDDSWSTLSDLGVFVAADHPGASLEPSGDLTVAIGPEGGWAPGEIDGAVARVSLGEGVLRTETAALAIAARFSTFGCS